MSITVTSGGPVGSGGITVVSGGPIGASPSTALTVLQIIQEVCKYVGIDVPSQVYGSTEREHVELASYANEVASQIAFDTHDWQRLRSTLTATGDGVTEAFDLPSDYRRMLKKARVWASWAPFAPLTHYADADEWLGLQVQQFTPVIGGWTIMADQMHVIPVIPSGQTVKFVYINNMYALGDDTTKFTQDTDTFVLNDRILKLGIIWYWKQQKGQPYAEDLETYQTALSQLVGGDKGSNILEVGRRRIPLDVSMAYPGPVGV